MCSWRRIRARGALCLLAWALLVAGGCEEKDKKPCCPVPDLTPAQDSPRACLSILRQAYEGRDIERYSRLFASDYEFVFAPNGVTGPYPTPEQWGLSDEITSAGNMFASPLVQSISLSFDQGDTLRSEIYPGTYRVEMTNIQLRLETRKPDGSQLTVAVPGGHCTFYFKKYPNELTAGGRSTWKIWRWEDVGIAGSFLTKGGMRSWGQLKSLYL